MRAALVLVGGMLAAAPGAESALAQPARLATAPPGASSCSGCHAPAGNGDGALPSLRGQTADEIVAAMRAYRTGERPATLMDRIARGFSEEETAALAAWLADPRRRAGDAHE